MIIGVFDDQIEIKPGFYVNKNTAGGRSSSGDLTNPID